MADMEIVNGKINIYKAKPCISAGLNDHHG